MYKYTGKLEIITNVHTMSTEVVDFTFYDKHTLTRDIVKQKASDTVKGKVFYGVSNMTYHAEWFMLCKFNDCGWCYFEDKLSSVQPNCSGDSGCRDPENCPVNKMLNQE